MSRRWIFVVTDEIHIMAIWVLLVWPIPEMKLPFSSKHELGRFFCCSFRNSAESLGTDGYKGDGRLGYRAHCEGKITIYVQYLGQNKVKR